jgi:hypothetical protein
MKCPKCGLENIHGAMYCEDCGTLIKTRETPVVSVPPPPPSRRNPPSAPPPFAQAPPPHYGAPPPPVQYASATVPVKPLGVQCPKCRKENMISAVYCGGCGISLTGMGGIPTSPNCYAKLAPLGGGTEFYLDRDKMLIGRRSDGDGNFPEIDLTIQDVSSSVSRKHAQLVKDELHVFVEDLGSSNGTFVNEQKVSEGVQNPVKDGDTIRIGTLSYILRMLK